VVSTFLIHLFLVHRFCSTFLWFTLTQSTRKSVNHVSLMMAHAPIFFTHFKFIYKKFIRLIKIKGMLSGLNLSKEMQIHFTYLEIGSTFYKQKDLCNKKYFNFY
jgi:hypothetical protein